MLETNCCKLGMLDHGITILESAVAGIDRARQDDADLWEALRTMRAHGASERLCADFWTIAGRVTHPPSGGYQALNATMNGICRELGVARSYKRC